MNTSIKSAIIYKYVLYKTTNLINNKFYVGAHEIKKNPDTYLGSGLFLQRAIKKYGIKNFKREILFACSSFVAKDKKGNIYQISVNDPRYLNGELVHVTKKCRK